MSADAELGESRRSRPKGTAGVLAGNNGGATVLTGVVVPGDKRGGRELGFPTANVKLDPSGAVLPADGVYAGWFFCERGERQLAAISIGKRPTYYGEAGERLVEAHLLDFEGDLYGQKVRLEVATRVRSQQTFGTSEELIAQMDLDVKAVRRLAADGR